MKTGFKGGKVIVRGQIQRGAEREKRSGKCSSEPIGFFFLFCVDVLIKVCAQGQKENAQTKKQIAEG